MPEEKKKTFTEQFGKIVIFVLALVLLAILLGSTIQFLEDHYTNGEDRATQRCQKTADESPEIFCLPYSSYAETSSTCSCVLQGSRQRITYPMNMEIEE